VAIALSMGCNDSGERVLSLLDPLGPRPRRSASNVQFVVSCESKAVPRIAPSVTPPIYNLEPGTSIWCLLPAHNA